MFNYLVEIFAQEKKRYLINGCGLLETDSSPTVSSLGRLPISTDAAYIHVNGDIGIPKQLYYVCKSRSECALLNITTGARESFDREMKPTAEFRRLTADELDKITMITKHTQNPQPYERWIKYYYENAEQIPDTPSARVNYFMGFAIVTLATLEKVNSTSDQLIIRGQDPIHSKYLWTSLMLLGSILPLRFDNKSIKNHVPGLDLKDEMGFFTCFSTTSLYETEFKKYLNKDHIRYFLTDFTEEAKRKKDLSAAALIASEAKLMTGDPSIPGEAAPYLSQHTGGVNALAVLRDGRLVSGSEDGTIKLWDFNTGRHSSILSTNEVQVRHLGALADGSDSFSQNTEQAHIRALVVLPDGRLVSSENPFRNRTRHIIKVWNLETQACLLTLPDERRDEGVLAVLGDGRLAIGTNKTVELWNLKTKNKLLTLRGHTEDVASLVDLGDDRLASGSRDNAVKIWNTITGNCEKTLLGHGSGDRNDMGYVTNGVKALVVLPDGRLASGSVDKTIKLWDVARGVCVMTLSGHEKHVTALAVLADGRLASGSEDKTIKLWDITTGKCVTTHTGHTYGVRFLAVLEDGRLVSGSGDHTIRLWGSPKPGMRMAKVPAATPVAVSAAVTAPISTATHAAPAPAMAGAGAGAAQPAATSGIVIAFERAETAPPKVVPPSSALTFALPQPVVTPSAVTEPRQTSKKVITLSGHSNSIYALVVLPDGRLISCSGDQFIKIWDPASGACLATLTGHTKTVSALVLLPDGRLASASWDDSIKIWDIASGTCVLTMTGQSKGFHALAVLADGRLVSGSGNNLIEIWDTASGTCRSSWKGHSGCVIGLVALSDGRLASGSHDESIKIWDVASGTCQMTLTGHSAFLIALTILSDGRLVSSSNDLSIKIWDPRSKDCLFTLTGHSVGVTALTALPNGHLISGDDHGVIKIWDTDARVCLATWDGSPCVRAFTLLHDGRLVSGSGINPYIQIWNRPVLVVTGPAPQLTALTPSAPGRIPAVVGAGDGAVVTAESKASPVAQPIPFNEAAFLRFSERLMQIEDHALTAAPAASVSEALLQNEAARIARLEFEYIVAKPLLQDYYHTLQASLYDTFLAAFTIHSGMVANQKVSDMQSYVSMGVSVIDYFCQSIPIASHISSAASAVLNQAISIDQSNKVNRLLALLLDHTKAAELANRIARNLSLAFEDEIVTLVKTEHPLIRWLKAQRDKLIFNDINTPQKAEAAVHAMQLIKLAMQAKLKRAQLETDEFIVLIKPGYDLQTLQDKRTELYAVPPVVSTPASLPLSPAAVSVIASPSTAGACLSPVTGTNTTPVSPPAPGVSPAELAELRAAHETEVAALRKEISKLASRMSTQQRGHEQDAAGAGLAYADPLGDESSRVTLVKLQEKMSHLAQRDPQIEAMLSELQEMSETINPARAAAEFNNKTFAFAEAVRVIKHVADQCYGADGHRLRLESSSGMISIAAELQGPAVREPKHVRGEAIMNVLSRYHLATFVSMSQLTNMLTHDEPAGYYHSAHVVTGAELVQDAVNRHALLTSPG